MGKEKKCKKRRYKAAGVIELVLLLVVIIGLVVIFKTQITNLVTNAFSELSSGASSIF